MEEFVVELTRRLGGDDPTKAVEEVVTGSAVITDPQESDEP